MPDFLTEYLERLTNSFLSTMNTPDDYLNRIALSAVIIIIGLFFRLLFKKLITRNVSDYKSRYTLHKVIKSTVVTLTVLCVLVIWIQAINALILLALLISIFVIFMVRGLTNNIIGYFVIRYRKYFKVGHRVEINNIIGDVIEINPVNFELLEVRNWLSSDSNTGRVIKLPNKIIFEESIEMIGIVNTLVWQEIKYVLSFDSDWRTAEQIMIDAGEDYFKGAILPNLEEVNKHLPTEVDNLQPVVSLNTNEDGIILILRYLVHYKNGTSVKTSLQRKILTNFANNPDIKFATMDIRILEE